ncbi:MAG: STAS domain-containing protein [Desulfobacteraceae bacterium]|jgi:anti-sigma B factor antagonist
MEITERQQDDVSIFSLSGRLDSNTSPDFEKRLSEVIRQGARRMVVDFGSLDYISSAGLRVILKATKDIKRAEGLLVLCAMKDYVREVFEIAGFDAFLPISTSLEDALQQF